MFPLYYRLDLPDRALTIIGDEIMDGIKFQIGDYTLTFDESVRAYMDVSEKIDETAQPLLVELGKAYEELGSIAAVHEHFLSLGNNALEKVAEGAVKIFSGHGIYNINAEKILHAKDFRMSALEMWAQVFSQVDEIYMQIENKAIAEKEARELSKETRGRLVGGGFGLTGAATGILKAEAVNMATGAIFSVLSMIGDARTDAAADKSKAVLYQAGDTLQTLLLGFSVAVNIIKQEVLYVLNIKPFKDDNVQQASIILENIEKGNIPDNKVKEAIMEALLSNPFNVDAYSAYFMRYGDETHDLDKMARFFHVSERVSEEKQKFVFHLIAEKFHLRESYDSPSGKLFSDGFDIRKILPNDVLISVALAEVNVKDIKEQYDFVKCAEAYIKFLSGKIFHRFVELTMYINAVEKGGGIIPSSDEDEAIWIYQHFRNHTLKEVVIPSRIRKVGMAAFAECSSLENVTFEEGAEIIEPGAFAYSGIKKIKLPNTLKTIGAYAFVNCKNLEYVELPKGLTSIEKFAFSGCDNLKQISIPDTVSEIGIKILGSNSVAEVICNLENHIARYCRENNYRIFGFLTKDTVKGVRGEYVIPDKYTKIDSLAFSGNENIREVTIPGSVKEIGERAFFQCSDLKKVVLSPGLEIIGRGAFEGCSSLAAVSLPNTLVEIGATAFSSCSKIEKLHIPEGVVSLASDVVRFSPVRMIILPESLSEIYYEDGDTKQRYGLSHPMHKCYFDREKTRFVCKPGTYAEYYCKEKGLQVGTSENVVLREVKKDIAEDKKKEELGDDVFRVFVIFLIVALIKWLFF